MGPYGSGVEFVAAVFALAMVFLVAAATVEFIAARRDRRRPGDKVAPTG